VEFTASVFKAEGAIAQETIITEIFDVSELYHVNSLNEMLTLAIQIFYNTL
jgi:hypothetical protein